MDQRQLAYHEAGHFVLNALLRNINFRITLDFRFPFPQSIWVNEKATGEDNKGQVTGIGIPIWKWPPEIKAKVVDLSYSLEYPAFYILNPNIAVAVSFSSVAGYVSEMVYADEEKSSLFGPDLKNFNNVVAYTLSKKFESNRSPEYEDARAEKLQSILDDLGAFFAMPEIEAAIKLVAKTLLEKEKGEDGVQAIDSEEKIKQLDSEIQKIFAPKIGEFQELINRQTPTERK